MTNTMRLRTPRCPACNESSIIEVSVDGFAAWQNGTLIQDAFPELSAAERETAKTGYHEACWNATFPDEDSEPVKKPRQRKAKEPTSSDLPPDHPVMVGLAAQAAEPTA